jgi:Domain of unknown function (DUF4189)
MKFKNVMLASMPLCAGVLLFAIAVPFEATDAQSCGGGAIQEGGGGVIACHPRDPGPTQQDPVASGPQWATRWGAIVVDSKMGKFGGADRMPSKRQAEKAAQKMCTANGGKNCKTAIAYHNQCGVLAWGDTLSTSSSGPDVEETTQRAITNCSKQTSNCQAYYAGCSFAEQVR